VLNGPIGLIAALAYPSICENTASVSLATQIDHSQAGASSGVTPESNESSTIRLVIRAEIISGQPSQSIPPKSSKRPIALIATAVAALIVVVGLVIVLLEDESSSPSATNSPIGVPVNASSQGGTQPTANEVAQGALPKQNKTAEPSLSKPESTTGTSAEANAVSVAIDEVTPAPSQGALQTIRGTVRVAIRVTIDQQGKVIATTAETPGPSRYFERISVDAAKKWTFQPASSNEARTALLRFHFTRDGATATAEH